MATKKKSSKEAPSASAQPAKFPARARKKTVAAENAPTVSDAGAAVVEVAGTVPALVTHPEPVVVAVAERVAVVAVEPTQEAIRAHAYALWRAEGGSAQANWLRAEAELRGR